MSGITKKSPGFTIVELLIVIVIIGILAAIVIVAYNGIQDRTRSASVQNDLVNISKQFQLFYVDQGKYPNTVGELDSLNVRTSRSSYLTDQSRIVANLVACSTSDAQSYSITAITTSGERLYATNSKGVTKFTGSENWITTANNYAIMCSSTLSGSSAISSGSGWSLGTWRAWTES